MQEFLFSPERSRICWRCWSCAADGTWALLLRKLRCWGGGRDCRRRRWRAALRLYLTFACTRSSLNTSLMLIFDLADTSTKPFSQLFTTSSRVLSVFTWYFKQIGKIRILFQSNLGIKTDDVEKNVEKQSILNHKEKKQPVSKTTCTH